MEEVLSPELDGANLTSEIDESNSNEGVSALLMNAGSLADYTLPLEELVAQSSELFGCDVETNTGDTRLEEHDLQFHSDLADNEDWNPSHLLQEREAKKLLSLQEALEETAFHFAKYEGTAYPQSAKQNRKRKSSAKIKQPLMNEKRKSKLRWKVFRTRGLYECNLCPLEFHRRPLLQDHKRKRHKKLKQSLYKLDNKIRQPSGGEKISENLNQFKDEDEKNRKSTVTARRKLSGGGKMNFSSSLVSLEWLFCSHCEYKSHRHDFFNIHMKRAHQEEEDGPAQEKRRRLDSLNSSGSKNRSGFSRIEVDLETSGSDAKSKNGRLAVLLECDTCHKVFNNRPSYNRHVLRHGMGHWSFSDHDNCANTNRITSADKADAKSQPQTLKEDVKKQSQKVTREGYVRCNVCRKEVREEKLRRHMLRHDPTKLVACAFCPYTSYLEYNVKSHMLKFHAAILFPKVSKTNNRSADYVSTSMSDRSNSASPQRSRVNAPSKTKKRSKGGEKMAQCTVCHKDVPKSLMSIHLLTHNKGKWLRCKHCDYTTPNFAQFKRHATSHAERKDKTNNDPSAWSECPYCDFSSRYMSNIHSHIKNGHPELSVPESVEQREDTADGDYVQPSEMSSESSDSGRFVKKSLNFSAIGKHISAVIPSRRRRAVKS